ncbi:MAG TPA: hypothetical protein VMV93_02190 [Chloroflexota bacterium]|nr:hypothetical protein [Chloroflexota bacterium]
MISSTLDELGPRRGVHRFALLGALGLAITVGLGIASHITHSATMPDVGLPASNSKELRSVSAYDAQVSLTTAYLSDLAQLNYGAAYKLLAPAVRANTSEPKFAEAQRQAGQIGQPRVWADSATTTRAEYVLAKSGKAVAPAEHRFALQQEGGTWWMTAEAPLPAQPAAEPNLQQALRDYVQHRAGTVWAGSIEVLRQEPFAGGQLLLFSYIDPNPPQRLTPERIALLNYYVNSSQGWRFEGGGATGLPAGMSVAAIALGLTTFGSQNQYVAYYGVIENAGAISLAFKEPSGAGHTLDIKGQHTFLVLNDRNPYEAVPFAHPFLSIVAKDTLGNTLTTNPPSPS